MGGLSRFEQFLSDGNDAYRNGRFREAALLFEQASRIARRHGREEQGFKACMWAANSWDVAGEPMQALSLLTDILAAPPVMADPVDVWIARWRWFEVTRCHNPDLDALQRRLNEMETLARGNPALPQANVSKEKANLLEAQGLYAQALEQTEIAWAKRCPKSFSHSGFAFQCVRLNLLLHRREQAGEWCRVLEKTNTDRPWSRVVWYGAKVELALCDGDSQEADLHSRSMEDAAVGVQDPGVELYSREMRVRATLLDRSFGDPNQARHPARALMAGRLAGRPEVYDIYSWRLLRIDYRLATVRHAVAMEPLDDK